MATVGSDVVGNFIAISGDALSVITQVNNNLPNKTLYPAQFSFAATNGSLAVLLGPKLPAR